MCVHYTHRVSSPIVSEEALGLGGSVVVGMMVVEGTTSLVSIISIICIQGGVMNYTTDIMAHWLLYVSAQ